MADDVVPDRLAEIKAQPSTEYLDPADKAWLIAEVERLRGALQALVNSTEATYYGISEYKAARAAAVALLAGPGGET